MDTWKNVPGFTAPPPLPVGDPLLYYIVWYFARLLCVQGTSDDDSKKYKYVWGGVGEEVIRFCVYKRDGGEGVGC